MTCLVKRADIHERQLDVSCIISTSGASIASIYERRGTWPCYSYAVSDEPSVSIPAGDEEQIEVFHCACESSNLDLQRLLYHIMNLASESIALKRDLVKRYPDIAVFEERPLSATAASVSSPDRAHEASVSSGATSQTEIRLLRNHIRAAEAIAVSIRGYHDELTTQHESRVRRRVTCSGLCRQLREHLNKLV